MRSRIVLLTLILFYWLNIGAQKAGSSNTSIELCITSTSQYCGGAAPTQEILDMLSKPKPLENKVLYIRRNSNNLRSKFIYTLTTDQNGRATLKLPAGKYCFVDESKKDIQLYDSLIAEHKEAKNQAGPIDPKCLMDWMSKSDFEVIVPRIRKKKVMRVKFNYFQSCNWAGVPCAEFRGQYPP